MTETAARRVGDYELLDLIGDGAQGRVFRARCVSKENPNAAEGEVVAVKILNLVTNDPEVVDQLGRQVARLRELSHPNVLRYREFVHAEAGDWENVKAIVMDCLDGETLQDLLQRRPDGLAWEEVKTIFEQALAALDYAASRGVTHRDVKPSNLFLCRDGTVKLLDFEVARGVDSGEASTAGWKGTFDYMAPDFVTVPGFRGDAISDLFSLGVCLYQALSGRLPFAPMPDHAAATYVSRWTGPEAAAVPNLYYDAFRVLSNSDKVLRKCLQRNREARYQTAADLLRDFRTIRYRAIKHPDHDEYELLQVLGSGGFGEVFKARRLRDNRIVAIKHMLTPIYADRFAREAKILRDYHHEHLVEYEDFIEFEDATGGRQYFLVMEHLEGMPGWTLRNRIPKLCGAARAREVVELFVHYLEALEFLHNHAHPIVHRDIKPGNLYAPPGRPDRAKIFDLGVALDLQGTKTAGLVPGTLDYMAPELAAYDQDRGSPQTDIYSLGLSLYEVLAGHPAFPRLSGKETEVYAKLLSRFEKREEPTFNERVFEQIPALVPILKKALCWNPAHRYANAAEMRVDLLACLRQLPAAPADERADLAEAVTVAAPGSAPREDLAPDSRAGRSSGRVDAKGRAVRLMVAGGLLAAVTAALAVSLAHRRRAQPESGPAPVLAPAVGWAAVATTPAGALIMVDGRVAGRTPCVLSNLPAGAIARARVSLEGHEDADLALAVPEAGGGIETNLVLAPKNGFLIVNSAPAGAAVFLDGREAGRTPGRFSALAGEREITLELTGYAPVTLRAGVRPDQETALPPVRLRRLLGSVLVEAELPPGLAGAVEAPRLGEVAVGDQDARTVSLPHVEDGVPAGPQDVRLQVSHFASPAPVSVQVEDGKTGRVVFALQPLPGILEILGPADLSARAGDLTAAGGGELAGLAAGMHRVAFTREGYWPATAEVRVLPGRRVSVAAPDLAPRPPPAVPAAPVAVPVSAPPAPARYLCEEWGTNALPLEIMAVMRETERLLTAGQARAAASNLFALAPVCRQAAGSEARNPGWDAVLQWVRRLRQAHAALDAAGRIRLDQVERDLAELAAQQAEWILLLDDLGADRLEPITDLLERVRAENNLDARRSLVTVEWQANQARIERVTAFINRNGSSAYLREAERFRNRFRDEARLLERWKSN
jgi:serine/threonine-protein kinase